MEWEEIKGESNFWNPAEVNDFVEGVIITQEQGLYGLQTTIEKGDSHITLPSHKVLQSRLKNCKIGEHIKVVFVGEEPPELRGRNPTKMYKVYRRPIARVEDV